MHCDYERTVNRLGNRRHCNFVKLFLWLWPLLESCSTLNTPVVVEVVWGKCLQQRRHKIAQIHFRFLSYGMTSSYSLLHPQKNRSFVRLFGFLLIFQKHNVKVREQVASDINMAPVTTFHTTATSLQLRPAAGQMTHEYDSSGPNTACSLCLPSVLSYEWITLQASSRYRAVDQHQPLSVCSREKRRTLSDLSQKFPVILTVPETNV